MYASHETGWRPPRDSFRNTKRQTEKRTRQTVPRPLMVDIAVWLGISFYRLLVSCLIRFIEWNWWGLRVRYVADQP